MIFDSPEGTRKRNDDEKTPIFMCVSPICIHTDFCIQTRAMVIYLEEQEEAVLEEI